MPSPIAMSEHDGFYTFNIESYLTKTYPNITKPARRAICDWVRERIDTEEVEAMVDQIVLEYALEQQGWTPEDDEDDDK